MDLDDASIRTMHEIATVLTRDPVPSVEQVLDLLRRAVPCDSVSFNDLTFTNGDFRYVIVPPDVGPLAERLKPVYDRLIDQHPLVAAARRQEALGAVRFCDVPGGDRLTETDLYREFYEPFGVRYQLAIQLPSPPDVVVGYALNRSAHGGEFSERDVAMVNALAAHLALHHRLLIDVTRAEAVASEPELAGGWAVLTVRSDGFIEASSSRVLSAAFAPDGQVPSALMGLLCELDAPSRPPIEVESMGGHRWRCVVHPIPVGPSVVVVRRLGEEAPEAMSLIDLGLTPRQIDTALELARTGGTNAQLAESLGIASGTVKKHLEVVFRILGVESRAAAVAALHRLTG